MALNTKTYKFKDHVYEKPYTPYYDDYKGHEFIIDHFSKEDEMNQHVWVKCTSNENILVKGYVHLDDLVEINGN